MSPGVCGGVWVGGVLIGGARLVDGCEVRIAGLVSCFTYNNTRSAVQRVGPRWSLARVCKNGLLWNWFRLTDLRAMLCKKRCPVEACRQKASFGSQVDRRRWVSSATPRAQLRDFHLGKLIPFIMLAHASQLY